MKKNIFIACIFLLLLILGIYLLYNQSNKTHIKLFFEEKTLNNEFVEIYRIDDSTVIYSNYTIYYVDKNDTKIEFKEALKQELVTIDEILNQMSHVDEANDGGSLYAENNNESNNIANIDFNMVKCNKIDSAQVVNKNIYISDFDLSGICSKS